MVKIAASNVHRFIVENEVDAKIVLAVHDQLIVECKEEIKEQLFKVIHHCMEEAGKIFIKSIPVVIDGKITYQWEK